MDENDVNYGYTHTKGGTPTWRDPSSNNYPCECGECAESPQAKAVQHILGLAGNTGLPLETRVSIITQLLPLMPPKETERVVRGLLYLAEPPF